MKKLLILSFVCIYMFSFSCGSKSDDKAAEMQDPGSTVNEEAQNNRSESEISILSASELIDMSAYDNLSDIQLYMKEKSGSFIHAKKGEFASFSRMIVADTAGLEIELPSSTLYVTIDPMQDWRVAHTIHSDSLSRQLMGDFKEKQFVLVDSVYNSLRKAVSYSYESTKYPGKRMLYCKTYSPWSSTGIYVNKVTWPCFVYEIDNIK